MEAKMYHLSTARAVGARRCHSTPDPEMPPVKPDPVPDEEPDPVPVQEPLPGPAPIQAVRECAG
ncbi:hypothetical protein AAKU55_001507 [Oxalobacteraceae bacterium GrIS 1.11]